MKTKIFFSRRKAFSLVELFVAMVIIAIFTSFVTSNVTSQSQTAKQETEKLAAYITDLMRKADRRHLSFTIN
ncbi:MAG: type II secretion system protein, partial [Synergistaceae bacterium]|nr:type II secretion system protein [Synergistaceae bacterium]